MKSFSKSIAASDTSTAVTVVLAGAGNARQVTITDWDSGRMTLGQILVSSGHRSEPIQEISTVSMVTADVAVNQGVKITIALISSVPGLNGLAPAVIVDSPVEWFRQMDSSTERTPRPFDWTALMSRRPAMRFLGSDD